MAPVPDPSATKVDMFKGFMGPPEWLDREFVENAMRSRENDQELKLLDYNIVAAVKPGDNFASVAMRCRATFSTRGEEKSQSFILKVEHYGDEGVHAEALANSNLFPVEIEMYSQIIPEMQRLYNQINPKEILAPRLSYSSLKPHKIVFIDDISPEFTMNERPLDFETSAMVFEKIGKFHALSFFMNGNNEASFDHLKNGFVSDHLRPMVPMMNGQFQALADLFRNWGLEQVADKYSAMIPNFFERLIKLFAKNSNGYNVLNHGDFHLKNVLFRNNSEGKAQEVRLIDFQLSIWATPAIDLFFALYAMANHEARDRRQELLRIYHNQFTKTLKDLGYLKWIPSFLDLQTELLRNGLIEVFITGFLMPMVFLDKAKIAEQTAGGAPMEMGNMTKMLIFTLEQPPMKAALMKILPRFLFKGFLD